MSLTHLFVTHGLADITDIANYSALKNSTFRVANCSLKNELSC